MIGFIQDNKTNSPKAAWDDVIFSVNEGGKRSTHNKYVYFCISKMMSHGTKRETIVRKSSNTKSIRNVRIPVYVRNPGGRNEAPNDEDVCIVERLIKKG